MLWFDDCLSLNCVYFQFPYPLSSVKILLRLLYYFLFLSHFVKLYSTWILHMGKISSGVYILLIGYTPVFPKVDTKLYGVIAFGVGIACHLANFILSEHLAEVRSCPLGLFSVDSSGNKIICKYLRHFAYFNKYAQGRWCEKGRILHENKAPMPLKMCLNRKRLNRNSCWPNDDLLWYLIEGLVCISLILQGRFQWFLYESGYVLEFYLFVQCLLWDWKIAL